jgi:peptidoglycan hydrolase CwlO-like protein
VGVVQKTKEEALMKAQKSFQNKIDLIDEKINVLNKTIDDLENEKLELLKKKDLLNKEGIL